MWPQRKNWSPNSPRKEEKRGRFNISLKKNIRSFENDEIIYERFISEGKYGKVYLGKLVESSEHVAIKEVDLSVYKFVSSSVDEIAILSRLRHPNILLFLGIIQSPGKALIVTEFAHGGSLDKIILNQDIELSWERRAKFGVDIARGMKYLFEQGILHRDLKCENCLIKQNGDVVVADFGLSKLIVSTKKNISYNRRHTVVGSIFSMAPEVIKGDKYNYKADIYSFGIILCGSINRIGSDPDILTRYDNFAVNLEIFRESFKDTCPETFLDIALKCCEFDPKERPEIPCILSALESIKEC